MMESRTKSFYPRTDAVCLLLFMSLCFFGCSTSGPTHDPAGAEVLTGQAAAMAVAIPIDVYHEVAPMETLWRISKMYGVDQRAIIEANGIRDPRSISVGQKLLIPSAQAARPVIPLYQTRGWSFIVIHHTASEQGSALSVDQVHHRRGFENGLGYHFLIDNGTLGKKMGQIEVGPRWVKQEDGAHANASGMNEYGIGISLVGNFSKTRVPEGQLQALVALVNILRTHYGIPLDRVIRHRDVPGKNTECPGNYFPWEEFKRRLLAAGAASG